MHSTDDAVISTCPLPCMRTAVTFHKHNSIRQVHMHGTDVAETSTAPLPQHAFHGDPTHTHTLTHTHTHTHLRTHTLTHTHLHLHTQTHTHILTHTGIRQVCMWSQHALTCHPPRTRWRRRAWSVRAQCSLRPPRATGACNREWTKRGTRARVRSELPGWLRKIGWCQQGPVWVMCVRLRVCVFCVYTCVYVCVWVCMRVMHV